MKMVQITPRLALDADRIIGITEISHNTDKGRETTCLIDMADQGRQLQYAVSLSLSEILRILNAEPEPPTDNGVAYTTTVEHDGTVSSMPTLPHMRRNWVIS